MGAAYEPLAGRARWARRLLWAAVGADALAVAFGLAEYSLLQKVAWGGVTPGELAANESRQAAVGLLQMAVLVVAAVVFVRWFHRAYANVAALGGERRFRTGWAIAGWLVPVLALVRPKQIATDIWRAGDPAGGGAPALHHLWWAAFVGAGFVSVAAFQLSAGALDLADFRTAAVAWIAADAVSLAAGLLALRVVADLTECQEARARALLAASPAG